MGKKHFLVFLFFFTNLNSGLMGDIIFISKGKNFEKAFLERILDIKPAEEEEINDALVFYFGFISKKIDQLKKTLLNLKMLKQALLSLNESTKSKINYNNFFSFMYKKINNPFIFSGHCLEHEELVEILIKVGFDFWSVLKEKEKAYFMKTLLSLSIIFKEHINLESVKELRYLEVKKDFFTFVIEYLSTRLEALSDDEVEIWIALFDQEIELAKSSKNQIFEFFLEDKKSLLSDLKTKCLSYPSSFSLLPGD